MHYKNKTVHVVNLIRSFYTSSTKTPVPLFKSLALQMKNKKKVKHEDLNMGFLLIFHTD